MNEVMKINGYSISDFKQSYTLLYLIESTIANYCNLSDKEKEELCYKLDKEISQKFDVPEASFVFEDNEHILDSKNIFFGKLENIQTGVEFLARYFFEKRQQYQRMCMIDNEQGSFTEDEFYMIKFVYEKRPISNKSNYVPYKSGFDKYIINNYNKVDALYFMWQEIEACLRMIDTKRTAKSMGLIDLIRVCGGIRRLDRYQKKFNDQVDDLNVAKKNFKKNFMKFLNTTTLMENEYLFLDQISCFLDGKDSSADEKMVFFCFNENVWKNLDEFRRKQAVVLCNELVAKILNCEKVLDVRFTYGENSYDFVSNDYLYVGDLKKDSAKSILHRIVYEYSFDKNYENVLALDESEREIMLKEIAICNKVIRETQDYGQVRDYEFIKCVSKTAKSMQEKIYKYIQDNLFINGKKVSMDVSKEEFLLDLYKSKVNRR